MNLPFLFVLIRVICVIPFVLLVRSIQLNGCGSKHNDVTKCDYLASEISNFPTDEFTITMWVKGLAPHTKDRYGEGEALFSYNTDRTIANAKYVYRSSEVGVWMYNMQGLLFTASDGISFAYAWATTRTDNSTNGCKEWCHLEFTWKYGEKQQIYKNGNLLATAYSNYYNKIYNTGGIMIGNRGKEVYPKGFPPGRPVVERQYIGDIQDVRIYDLRLRVAHLKDIMNGYLGPSIASSLKFYWTLFGFEFIRQRTKNQEVALTLHGSTYDNKYDEESPIHLDGSSNIHQPFSGLVAWPQHNFYGDNAIDTISTSQILELENQIYGKNKENDSSKKLIVSINSLQGAEISNIQSFPSKIFDGRSGQILGKGSDTKITAFVSEGLRSKIFKIPIYANACSELIIGDGSVCRFDIVLKVLQDQAKTKIVDTEKTQVTMQIDALSYTFDETLSATTQILAGLSFTAFYSYFAMNFKPYVEFGDDLLYNVCLFQLFSVLFIGLLTKLNVSPLQSKYDDIRVTPQDPADLRAAAGNPNPDDFLPWVVIFTHMACMAFAFFSIVNEMRTAKRYQKAKRQHEFDQRNRVRQTLRKWAKARRMAMLQQAKRRANGNVDVANESLEDATKKAMEDMERQAEQRELEQEMKQLHELKEANKHITDKDDSELNAAQRELKEFLMESQHEVSRRKETLKKQVDNLQKETEVAAEKFNNQVEVLKTKQHERLMARLKKRQHKKGNSMASAVSQSISKKMKNTKVLPVKSNNKRAASKPVPPPPPPKKK